METAREFFGDQFISYCINAPSGEVPPLNLSVSQREAIEALENICQVSQSASDEYQAFVARMRVMQYDEASQSSIANTFRKFCGGGIDVKESSDPIEATLFKIASDAYPATLFTAHPLGDPGGMSASITGSLAFRGSQFAKALTRLILEDPDLKRLFPDAPAMEGYDGIGIDISSMIYWSTGSGSTIQVANLAGSLVRAALQKAPANCTPVKFYDLIRQSLRDARKLAKTGKANTKALVGLSNVVVPEGSEVGLHGGIIRPFAPGDSQSFIDPAGIKSVLEVPCQIEILGIFPATDSDSHWGQLQGKLALANTVLRRLIDLERLAILFACDGPPQAPIGVATTVLNPIQSGNAVNFSIHHSISNQHPLIEIDAETSAKAAEWSAKVSEIPENLDMGMRRILSAASERFDPMDSFVDAVICWENLFGTNQGEVGFRIAGSISHVLEPHDSSTRKKLFDEVKKMYSVRSNLVHGTKEPGFLESSKYKDRSIEIAASAFKALCDRADLLALKSTDRGNLLLIGG
ncbi:hypothetical protein ACFVZH_24550 [Streptomyces sp. NPDC059534]|uniref:hypothetical protein n=1 Tax=Streptomyces sp. NPDC059534 TaxID=3346859 RepID=UPI0036B5E221